MGDYILTLTSDETYAVKSWNGSELETTNDEKDFLTFINVTDADTIRDQINNAIGAGTVGTSGPRR